MVGLMVFAYGVVVVHLCALSSGKKRVVISSFSHVHVCVSCGMRTADHDFLCLEWIICQS